MSLVAVCSTVFYVLNKKELFEVLRGQENYQSHYRHLPTPSLEKINRPCYLEDKTCNFYFMVLEF